MRLVVSKGARRDLKAIARYSEKEWGTARKVRYLDAIRERFAALLRHPAPGAAREDIASGYRSVIVGRHIVFYRLADDEVVIVRVLHQRMDVRLHF
ncbi:MAG TPA: type II toxin-antitoxin system RelE/ParE family toxin [Rhizomicrobium sp.]|jgi:toxin ParE1/3/4|nr:type II toxin-antitoxin system RelE/ParE family toxin [Rhizomicrobium sp.]